jgi:cob(I)alamin adenosyltransferase
MIHVYYGDGAGKTTAAMGLALRAYGRGMRIGIAQFLKGGDSGERRAWETLPGCVLFPVPHHLPFTWEMTGEDRREYRQFVDGLLDRIEQALPSLDLLVLDEWGDAVKDGWINRDRADALLDSAKAVEVVVTAHGLSESLRDRADYLTEMRNVRHPFERGLPARPGIEY